MAVGETTLSTKARPSASRLGHGRNGAALVFARDNHDAALAGLVLGKPTVDPVFFAVGRLNVAAKIAPIDLNRAGKGSRP